MLQNGVSHSFAFVKLRAKGGYCTNLGLPKNVSREMVYGSDRIAISRDLKP